VDIKFRRDQVTDRIDSVSASEPTTDGERIADARLSWLESALTGGDGDWADVADLALETLAALRAEREHVRELGVTVAGIRKRAKTAAKMANGASHDDVAEARLNGKAFGYLHAAELVDDALGSVP
jgi:hypothetical protein